MSLKWLEGEDPVEYNKKLAQKASAAEKRAEVLEERAKIRERLKVAEGRCKKARSTWSFEGFTNTRFAVLSAVIIAVFLLSLKACS